MWWHEVQGLRRIARAMESESNMVHALLSLHVLPCLEEILLRTSDLRALARTPLRRFAALGLRTDLCQGALEAATLGFAKAQHMLLLVADAASQVCVGAPAPADSCAGLIPPGCAQVMPRSWAYTLAVKCNCGT